MRIVSLEASNVKRLKAVAIRPDSSLVQITGENASGKSSVLDSIFYALAGTKGHASQPIRRGELRAVVRLDLGEIVVTRKFTASGTSLEIEANGAVFKSPQTMLDKMIGELSFDPLSFSRLPKKQQFEQLRGIVKVDVDLEALDRQAESVYAQRTTINRTIVSLSEKAKTLEANIQPGADVELTDLSAMLAELAAASDHNAAINLDRQRRVRITQEAADSLDQAKKLREQALQLVAQAEVLEADAAGIRLELEHLAPLSEPVKSEELLHKIEAAREENRQREQQQRARVAHQAAVDELTAAKLESELHTETLDLCTRTKQEAIARATMPIAGLSFGDGEILYNEVPFDQASSAEQVRVATAIGMALNPKLRILCIKDGSLLDETSLAIIAEMAEAHDFQVWIERVDSSGSVGIVMEDGAIRGAFMAVEAPDEENEVVVAGVAQ